MTLMKPENCNPIVYIRQLKIENQEAGNVKNLETGKRENGKLIKMENGNWETETQKKQQNSGKLET